MASLFSLLLVAVLYSGSIHALNFNLPFPNQLVFAGTSVLTTWGGLGNATATNLYVATGASADNCTIISIVLQNTTSTSTMAAIPKDAPNGNTFLLLVGNDTPPSQATVGLSISFGSSTTPSSVATGSATPTASASANATSSIPLTSSLISATATSSTSGPTASSSDASTSPSNSLSTGAIAGVAVAAAAAGLGLVVVAILFARRRRNRKEKRHTELFDDPTQFDPPYTPTYSAAGSGIHHNNMAPLPASPFDSYSDPAMSYSRSIAHSQAPAVFANTPPGYPPHDAPMEMVPGPQPYSSRTELPISTRTEIEDSAKHDPFTPSVALNKPDEVLPTSPTTQEPNDKPHSKS
ncbi:hypothetical protein DM01DRAFT_1406426 [Hesseltinella vesiculosa]|uniref:Mid2 domain-containing protein n=1 Tax=Hesseltinella vesiculosa TaxID=101127 RepID=A0A1X2GMI5_9FUNG|nr:hypothetical protein DM01DRAFT_1406426 [Hesseltinella vesiculosa]